MFLLTCNGPGGSGSQSTTVTVTPPQAGTVVVSGRITFDRVPFRTLPGLGLDPNNPIESPARQVVVEAIDPGAANAILASTITNAAGEYSLSVPASRNIFIRAKAQMLKADLAPTWNFNVRNNTNSDALYALDGASFDTGTGNSTRNLRADSGWGGIGYTDTRAAAPFAILDTIYRAKELIMAASASTDFPELDLFWSPDNRPSVGPLCPDEGDISTSFYIGPGGTDECAPSADLPHGIYILGEFLGENSDTDEFDQHVISHEFGHYLEDNFSRADSPGGEHDLSDLLDLRLAFSEGWGNAYSGMTLADPIYRDSRGTTSDGGFDMESGSAGTPGWFSEASVHKVLWDLYDSTDDGADSLSLTFAPLWDVMLDEQRSTEAFTSIFSFASALRQANGGVSGAINARLASDGISDSGPFAENETNSGGSNQDVLPVYIDVTPGQPVSVPVCTNAALDIYNKLGNRRFLRLNLAQAVTVTVTVTGLVGTQAAPPPDPDMSLWTRGAQEFSEASGTQETIQQRPLSAGTHIIEVYECTHVYDPALCHTNPAHQTVRDRTCMSVSVTAN